MQACRRTSRDLARIVRKTHYSTASNPEHTRRDLRALLRETAQPVAVVTSLMPQAPSEPHPDTTHYSRFHGATLSSFSSIALDPHPLVAFSLRVPSRMATSLKDAHAAPPVPSHMVVNILSAAQAAIAVRFSRPDLHPHPFAHTPYTLTSEGLPAITGSLGALSCRLIAASWPLHDIEMLDSKNKKEGARSWQGDGIASELFIAQVTRVESLCASDEEDSTRTSPLLYYRRRYATTCDLEAPDH